MAKTIIVSNRLPVSIQKKEDKLTYHPSAGGLATGLGSIYKSGDNIWLGWPGIYLDNEENKLEVTQELAKENMAPVYLTQKDIEDFYEGFSNSTLWPLFHYFPKYCVFEQSTWQAYKDVNQYFCDELMKYAKSDDIIWIHDYQLLLLPQMVRERIPNATIGFFQHIPFPSYEIFRILPWRDEILRGMVGADLIGFHTHDDVRHFLSAASRIIGLDNKMGSLRVDNRLCSVDSFPMGIDYDKFEQAAISEATKREADLIKKSFGETRLIISIDRLDYSKGIPERLIGFDLFLQRYPEYRGKISLILVVVPSRDQVDLYKQLKISIDELVGRINGKYGKLNWTPIHYFYRSFPFESLSAFYSISEVALVTPLRDGMNLVCKEFVASRTDKKGVLILSEMAGAAKDLSDAIIINPYNVEQIVDALHKAFTMPEDEQIRRNEDLQYILKRYDINTWVQVFMTSLKYTKEKQEEMAVKIFNDDIKRNILEHYQRAEKRAFFLDYDGTLMPFHPHPEKVRPDQELYDILYKLSSDPKNRVIIISGRDKDTLDRWMGDLHLDMIAEHGVWLKEGRPYWSLFDYITGEWKADIQPILELYVDRTPGTFIEKKDYSLVWHYRKADKTLGELRARELVDHLQYLVNVHNLTILEGNKVIEIKNAGINKGKAAARWLQQNFDFILAAGDDWTDEDTFETMPESSYTLKVGLTGSKANYNIKTNLEMRELLKAMISISEKMKEREKVES
ncbi:MAG TPA: bifunctional alpha,alpha-trehalose-phosphate synthase (UDP-forming)/trehalose-phosphatase [Cytophagaceae bacterium]